MAAERYAVVYSPIAAADLRELVSGPGMGAVCTFEGTVRDHTGEQLTTHLTYEAYEGMALRVFRSIAAAAEGRWPGIVLAIHHRVGHLAIGDVSVAIAVGSEHRAAAFEACRFAIDRLKVSAPIWKKEFGPDGSFWVEGPSAEPVADAPTADGEGAPDTW